MSAVEDRIVSMKFDSKQFEAGAKTSLSILDRLKAALNFKNSGKGLTDLQNTANKFSLQGLASGAAGIGAKFSAMSVVAAAALGSIVVKAVDAGLRVAKAFTLEPLMDGFREYETKLGSVQTILANTQASGATLKDVNSTLQELNAYSDQTIYNFGEMAKNIGTFTAAGVDLKTATGSIKGIANLAALSGSNSQQASTAMYQLSQAISSGRVSLQDWNSVVNAGMGGTVFQRALAQTAERMGTLDKGAVKLTGKMKNATINGKSFRESITAKPGEESWLTSDVLTATLNQFTGDMKDAELAAMGFSESQIKSIQAQAQTAKNAATQVKTFTQLIGTLKESAGSGYAQTAEILIGDFEEAKVLFTDINNIVGAFIGNQAEARNKMLQDFKDLGGRTKAIAALKNIFDAFLSIAKPISQAFRDIFPATTGKQLFELVSRFLEFTKTLKIGATTAQNLRRTFAGVFAIFSIGVSLVKAILGVLGDLFGLAADGSGSFLEMSGSVGDFLVALDEAIKKGDLFGKFFGAIGDILADPIGMLKELGKAFATFFGEFKVNPFDAVANGMSRLQDRLSPLAGAAGILGAAWEGLMGIFRAAGNILAPVIEYISKGVSQIGDAISKGLASGDFSGAFDALNTGLLAGLVLVIKKFLDKGLNIDLTGGLVGSIKDTFGALTDTLSALQTQVQAKTLILIAGAVALLVASIVALSLIDSGKLTKSLTAIAVAFGQLLAAMAILTKISGAAGFVKVPVIAGAMILLAGAVLILTAAVKNLSDLSWEELMKGLIGVGVLLGQIVLVSAGLNKAGGPMIRAGLAMIPLAIGIKILASAVKDLGSMDLGTMVKGLAGLAGSLVIIAGAMQLMPKGLVLQAAGLLILSVALNAIAKALSSMGGMSWEEIAKAMVVLAGSLVILGVALTAMSGTIAGSAGLLVAAAALAILAPVLKIMSSLSWEEIAKGMVTLAGSLLILALGLTAMSGTILGAGALLVAAAALAVLTPVLVALGAMSWESILKGLAGLAGVFLVLGVAGLVMGPVVPIILALSAALLIFGTAIALIGGGAIALATAFAIFTAAGTAGVAVLLAMINLIPQFLAKFAEGIIGFATTLASQATVFVGAFTILLTALLDAVIKITPKLAQTLNVMIKAGLSVLRSNGPAIAAVGLYLLTTFLTMIRNQIPRLVSLAGDIIIRFLSSLRSKIPGIVAVGVSLISTFMSSIQSQSGRLLQQGASMVISFINNLASTIRSNTGAMNAAGANLASAIISGMTSGIFGGIGSVISAARSVAQAALSAAKAALDINSPSKKFAELGRYSSMGFAGGIAAGEGMVARSSNNVAYTALSTMRDAMAALSDEMPDELNLNPVISPVLDLSQFSREASGIGAMLDQKALRADASYRQAVGIANLKTPVEQAVGGSTTKEIQAKIEQNIYAPKMPSAAELYRDTRSLFALTKEALEDQ